MIRTPNVIKTSGNVNSQVTAGVVWACALAVGIAAQISGRQEKHPSLKRRWRTSDFPLFSVFNEQNDEDLNKKNSSLHANRTTF